MAAHRTNAAAVKITAADTRLARERAAATIDYYRSAGLAEARSRAFSLVLSGAVPIVGLLAFGWSPTAMMVFMIADALITVMVDWLRYPLAGRWMAESHRRDHQAGEILGIVGGLEDGTNTRNARDNAPTPATIIVIGSVCTLFLIPVIGAAFDKLGLAPIRAVLAEPLFPWLVGGDALLRVLGTLRAVWTARRGKPGEAMLFAESGGVAVLYVGLLVLVWLPLNWGEAGLLAMFAILYLVRVAFGIFTLWWMPRTLVALERRAASDDWAPRVKAS